MGERKTFVLKVVDNIFEGRHYSLQSGKMGENSVVRFCSASSSLVKSFLMGIWRNWVNALDSLVSSLLLNKVKEGFWFLSN